MTAAASPQLLHHFFEEQAALSPAAVATVCGTKQLTYSELDSQANQLARLLRARGVKRGACVGLLLPRGTQVYLALLAILKSGAAYVPLDPDYPEERVAWILSDCQACLLIASTTLAAKAAGFKGKTLFLEELDPEIRSQSSVS